MSCNNLWILWHNLCSQARTSWRSTQPQCVPARPPGQRSLPTAVQSLLFGFFFFSLCWCFIPFSIHTNMERKDAAVGLITFLHSSLMFPHPNTSKFAYLSEPTPILCQSNDPIQALYRFTTCTNSLFHTNIAVFSRRTPEFWMVICMRFSDDRCSNKINSLATS